MKSDFLDEDTVVFDQNGQVQGQASNQQAHSSQTAQPQSRQAEASPFGQPDFAAADTGFQSPQNNGYVQPSSIRILLEGHDVLKNQVTNLQTLQSFTHHKNKLINACAEMLAFCVVVNRLPKPDDLHQHQQVLKEAIGNLKQKIAGLDYPPSVADKTCFLFCVVLDEFIMHSPWGENSGWENHTLLSELFGMRNGGEQFFQVTEKALRQPNQLMDWLELVYVFLKMDFRGQYRLKGRERLDALMHQLELLLNPYRKSADISAATPIELPSARKPHRRVRFGGQFVLFAVALVLVWGGASFWYQNTLEQRARGFITLPDYTTQYFDKWHAEEYIYESTEEEMERAKRVYGDPSESLGE
jgi:type VI secretion system protein ImpK